MIAIWILVWARSELRFYQECVGCQRPTIRAIANDAKVIWIDFLCITIPMMPKWMQFIWITFYNKISIKIGSRFWEYSWKDGIWEEKFGNCVSCQFFWAFLFENASDICFVPASLDQKNMKLGMIHQNKIIRSHFIGKAISLIKTKAAASTDHRLSDRISFCQVLTSTGAVSWFLAINAV